MKHFLLTGCIILCFFLKGVGQSNTNLGDEFWIAIPPNTSVTATIQLYISSLVPTNGTIQSAYPGVNQNFSVTPGIVTQISLPGAVVVQGGTEDKGIHITADDPIAVYGLNNQNASTDAFLALPVTALGVDYRILTYAVAFNNFGSCFTVVATQDGTDLTIFNSQTNATSNVTINAGQTYHVESPNLGDDLTGSRVQSNFPVAVFGSMDLAQVPIGCTAGDHMVEQMFPTYSWGKNFVTVPLAGRDASGDIFRILAGTDATEIEINGAVVATINAGEFFQTNLSGYNSINCSQATLVAQYAKGQNCSGSSLGDPFMMLLLPKEQYLTDYTIINVAGVVPFNAHWVNVVAPDYALGTIYEDGVLIPTGAFTQIGTTNYYGAQRSVTQGSHSFNSTFPFGLSVYGWRTVDSYGYPGGGSMSPVATVDSISLSPDTLYGDLNVTNICLTARVLNSLNNPVEGILVNFVVTGINPLFGNGYTNALGEVQYCYTQTGTVSGIDHIYAEAFGFHSDTSIVFWSYQCADPVTGGSIGSDQSGCGSFTPLPLTNIGSPTGYTGTIEYMWQQSIVSGTSGFTSIPTSNSPVFSPGPLSQTTWFRRLARVVCTGNWNTAALSNVVEMTVHPNLPVSVMLLASGNPVCAGTLVTFTASPTNGGASPIFQWTVNGISAGGNSPIYSYVPLHNDVIICSLTSSELCPTGSPAASNPVTMSCTPVLPAGVSIVASPNPFCPGSPVTCTATPVNGGGSPAYQWKVNGINVGSNASVYAFNPLDNDSVQCVMTSNLVCVTNNPASSGKITLNGTLASAVSFSTCFDTITTLNAKPFRLKGGVPIGGTYSGPGVNSVTGIFTPSAAGTGTKTITYTYSNAALCSSGKTKTITVQPTPVFTCGNNLTDVRDNKVYPTVTIGSHCWMAANLNFGLQTSDLIHQRDNCLNEKYCYQNLSANCEQRGANYQWDEVMRYDDTPGLQGLCPAGWHVPTEAEWNTLFANWGGNGFAGAPLKYSGFSGFNALLSGVNHQNVQWDFQDLATFFWSSTPYGSIKAWSHGLNDLIPSVSLYPSLRSNAFSVRCLMD